MWWKAFMAAAAGLSFSLTGCSSGGFRATRPVEMQVDWNGYTRILVECRNGSVDLAPETRDDLSITGETFVRAATPAAAERYLDDIRVVAAADPDDPQKIAVRVEYPQSLERHSPGAKLVLRLPADCTAEIRTGNGAVSVAKLDAAVDVHTNNGAVRVEDVGGPTSVRTTNGAIRAMNVRGDVRAETSNGAITLQDVRGNVTAHTSNGRITAVVTPGADATVELVTSNGAIDATLPATVRGTVSATTNNGSVSVFTADDVKVEQSITKRSYRGTLNGGGDGRIVARTSNGSLRLRFE